MPNGADKNWEHLQFPTTPLPKGAEGNKSHVPFYFPQISKITALQNSQEQPLQRQGPSQFQLLADEKSQASPPRAARRDDFPGRGGTLCRNRCTGTSGTPHSTVTCAESTLQRSDVINSVLDGGWERKPPPHRSPTGPKEISSEVTP